MARGWESKSVEEQRLAADQPPQQRAAPTAEERQREQKRRGLEMSRARVRQDLAATTSPVRRQQLEAGLAFLEEELSRLGARDQPAR